MKRIFFGSLLAVLFLTAANGFARGKETPEEVLTAYVAALNAKDEKALRALYHPNSDFRLTPLQQQFFNDAFTRELERTPGEGYTSELVELERGVLPMLSIVDWSSNPLMRMTVTYTEEGRSEMNLVRFLSKGGQRWFIAFPMPNAKMLGAYETYLKDKAEGRVSAGATATKQAGANGDAVEQDSPAQTGEGVALDSPAQTAGAPDAAAPEAAKTQRAPAAAGH